MAAAAGVAAATAAAAMAVAAGGVAAAAAAASAVAMVASCRPPSPPLPTQAWSLLSIFLSTIVALVLEPLPVGACAFISVTVALVTKCLTFAQAFSAFRNDVIWMIVVSFFFARGKGGMAGGVTEW